MTWVPAESDAPPRIADRLSVFLTVNCLWFVLYEAVIFLGAPPNARTVYFSFENGWPVVEWTGWLYLSAYALVDVVPFLAASKRDLRHFAIRGWTAMAVIFPLFLALPFIAPPRPFTPSTLAGRLLEMGRGRGSEVAAFPSFHVVWAFIAAGAYAARWKKKGAVAWLWAALVSASCLTTGQHALVDVLAGLLVALLVYRIDPVWAYFGDATDPEVWCERLTALDAKYLDLEVPTAPMHLGSVMIFEGTPPSQNEMADLIASRMDRIPRYGQRLAFVPFRIGLPVWVDAAAFDIPWHLRRVTLQPPGGRQQFLDLVGELFARPLDFERPLWEMWVVEGLPGGRFAVLTKTHHCLMDGLSGVDVTFALLDADQQSAPIPAPALRRVRKAPNRAGLLLGSLRPRMQPPGGGGSLREFLGGLGPILRMAALGPAPSSSLTRSVSAGRRWEMLALDLDEVKRVRTALGGTVNDVLLAVVAGALRELLLGRGERPIKDLRTMIPVSIRRPEGRGTLGNQLAAVLCSLPVAEPDPAERLRKVSQRTARLKEGRQALGSLALLRIAELVPPALAGFSARLGTVLPWFNLVVTNLPGPQKPLYYLGRKLLAVHPMLPLAKVTTVSVAMMSYDGTIDVGLLGDDEHATDLAVLACAIPKALAELTELAR